jgi:hypothetical protein
MIIIKNSCFDDNAYSFVETARGTNRYPCLFGDNTYHFDEKTS